MPLFGKKSKAEEAGRKRLEYQLYLAKHGPDNVVDVSSCELKHVPSGTYAICRVLLKEVLLLHSNHLKDLKEDGHYGDLSKLSDLRVLDVYNNQLIELPPNIDRLSSLQILNLQQNKLKSIPTELCRLNALQTLNLKENELHHIPEQLGELASLRTLDISHNKITRLPKSLWQARCLETLIVDVDRMEFPPSDICKAGTAEMMKFLCQEAGVEYQSPSQAVVSLMTKPDSSNLSTNASALQLPYLTANGNGSLATIGRTRSLGAKPDTFDQLTARAMTYENLKDERRKELLRLEGELLVANKQQMALLEKMSANRRDLLRMVAKEQTDCDMKFQTLQDRRELDRKRFLATLTNMEEHTKALIAQLLDINAKARRTESLLEQEERARLMEEDIFKIQMDEYERFRKQEVKRALETNVCQYFSFEQLHEMHETRRELLAWQAKFEDKIANDNLELLLQNRDRQICELLQRLIVEEQFQKEALLALMEQRDARSSRLNRQIELIQRELAHLSMLERRNKDEREADILKRLREQREALCQMMIQLLDEKMQRSKELQKRLIEMEKERLKDQVDFWLIHYQRLLDTKPDALLDAERQLDMAVIKVLNVSGAEDYVPAFARHHVTAESMLELTEEDLQKMGMYEVGLRKNVLQAIDGYKAEKKLSSTPPCTAPAASASTPVSPSSPPTPTVLARFEMECVICMAEDCGLIFLPCGHVCSCRNCGEQLSECPLCRGHIDQRIDLRAGSIA